jgi:integrase/recombinase XerD
MCLKRPLHACVECQPSFDQVGRSYAESIGVAIDEHALRATAATNALDDNTDIAKVEEWLGHANIATMRIYDKRKSRPEGTPTFKMSY